MQNGTQSSSARRLPRARITLPMFGLVAVALAIGPVVNRSDHPSEAAILSMARDKGIVPAEENPSVGTEIFQWDPELQNFAPFYVGAVVDANFRSRGRRYTLVRRPRMDTLYLAIRPGEMRYWVRKP